MIGFFLWAIVAGSTANQAAPDTTTAVGEDWARCIDSALIETAAITDYEARVSRIMTGCISHERDFRRLLVKTAKSAGGDSESPELSEAIEIGVAGARAKFRARAERGLASSPLIIWNGLRSGSSAQAVAAQLAHRGIATKATKPDRAGWSALRLKDRIPVAGHQAAVELSFYKDALFWSEVRYSFGSPDSDGTYKTLIEALAATYGPAVTNNYLPDVVSASSVGVVLRQNALFRKGGLQVDVTVNSSPFARTAAGGIQTTKTVILTYWREKDAHAYAEALAKNDADDQAKTLERAKEDL